MESRERFYEEQFNTGMTLKEKKQKLVFFPFSKNCNNLSHFTIHFFHSELQHHERGNEALQELLQDEDMLVQLYKTYIEDVCSNSNEMTFCNRKTDPIYAETKKEFKSLMKKFKKKVLNSSRRKDATVLNFNNSILIEFLNANENGQHKILSMLQFEYLNSCIGWKECDKCNTVHMINTAMDKCKRGLPCGATCKYKHHKTKISSEQLLEKQKKEDPIWIDENGQVQFELPNELKGLHLSEKLLIQRYAVLMPVVHIYKGSMGIKGHTVMFRKDIKSLCKELPRKKVDIICVIKEYENSRTGNLQQDIFKVRRQKVLKALYWLKRYHVGYSDVDIVEENLSWMGGSNESNLDSNLMTYYDVSEADINEFDKAHNNETVAALQTDTTALNEITYQGTRSNHQRIVDTNKDSEIVNNLREETEKQVRGGLPAMMFPYVEEDPVNEFNTERIFADSYPWLFPGGFGDITYLSKSKQRTNAIPWTKKLMRWKDGRFMSDPLFTFHLPNFLQRHQNSDSGLFFVREYIDDPSITVEEIQDQIRRGDMSFIHKLVHYTSQKVIGSDSWWRNRKQELDKWLAYHLGKGHGAPTLFLTFSCAEFWWKDLLNLICKRCVGTEDENDAKTFQLSPDSKEGKNARYRLVEKYSAIVQEYFQMRLDNWMKTIGKRVFGIKYSFIRYEFAKGRGQIHAHIVAITYDQSITKTFHDAWKKRTEREKAGQLVGTLVRERYDLTAEKPEGTVTNTAPYSFNTHPCSKRFHEINDFQQDRCEIVDAVHIHECNNFCLRQPRSR